MASRPVPLTSGGGFDGLDALVAAWPGPAALLANDGTVRRANPAASELVRELMARAGHDGLAAFVTAARADGQARTDTIVIAGHPGVLTYDVSVVPLAGAG